MAIAENVWGFTSERIKNAPPMKQIKTKNVINTFFILNIASILVYYWSFKSKVKRNVLQFQPTDKKNHYRAPS